METDKEKSLPEKSPSFSSRNESNKNENPCDDHDQSPESQNNPQPSEPTAANPETENAVEEQPTDVEDSSSPLPPDLNTLSEEIDQFISALSSSNPDHESEPPEVPESLGQFAVLVEAKVANYDSGDGPPVRWTQLTDEDSSTFVEAVERVSKLSTLLRKFSSEPKYASSMNRIGGIFQRAMSYVEEEFRSLVEDYKIPDSSDDNTNDAKSKHSSSNQDPDQCAMPESDPGTMSENIFPGYSDEVVTNLNRLVKVMISGGHEAECCQVYFISRRNALEDCLHSLGFDKFSIDDVQKMHWESLEREIVAWIRTYKQFAAVVFPRERNLTATVFSDALSASISESLFGSLSRGVMIQLLNFAEALTMTKRSAEKLFKFLDIYETLHGLIPTMDGLFPNECVEELKSEASMTRCRLGEAMICIFCELENSIKSDAGKTPVPGGAVHPLTRYTMNYLKYACEYKDTLEQVFKEHKKIERADSATRSDYDCNSSQGQMEESQSPFELQITKVMDLLDSNLEGKSKLYKDPSLSLVFLMNNGRYILQKIKGSTEINSLMGDPWCRKRSSDLRSYHKNYVRETWGRLLHCLNHEGLNVNGKVVKPVLKERFKSFNAMFDEIHKAQSTWVVSDEQLQSELRVSISAVVIPAYRSFMGRFSQYLTPGRQSEKYIKYQPEDIETYIDELFDGNATPMGKRRL
ncbi:hypothetical protein RJ640_028170 [Escallonia rubra]|uniref:Exocyst subunit Exo70 family protein n=1 Tax=Escallonia rubra TaxID=112253 RepID=A0AA88UB70_9ASTE|nr:hypothetical protein RJ640_028170 [Escallonia rubra]